MSSSQKPSGRSRVSTVLAIGQGHGHVRSAGTAPCARCGVVVVGHRAGGPLRRCAPQKLCARAILVPHCQCLATGASFGIASFAWCRNLFSWSRTLEFFSLWHLVSSHTRFSTHSELVARTPGAEAVSHPYVAPGDLDVWTAALTDLLGPVSVLSVRAALGSARALREG